MMSIYQEAIKEPYQFLYINLMKRDINQMFMVGFNRKIKILDDE